MHREVPKAGLADLAPPSPAARGPKALSVYMSFRATVCGVSSSGIRTTPRGAHLAAHRPTACKCGYPGPVYTVTRRACLVADADCKALALRWRPTLERAERMDDAQALVWAGRRGVTTPWRDGPSCRATALTTRSITLSIHTVL